MTRETLIRILRDAHQIEVEGAIFYRQAAAAATVTEARDIFVYLAEQEELHQAYIAGQLRRLDEGKPVDLSGLKGMQVEDRSALFAGSVRRAREIDQSEASALHTGLLLERNAHAFYRDAAERASDAGEKELYATLRDWELVHVRTLEAAYDEVRQRIWSDSRFAPF
jgi:rubrerythrin